MRMIATRLKEAAGLCVPAQPGAEVLVVAFVALKPAVELHRVDELVARMTDRERVSDGEPTRLRQAGELRFLGWTHDGDRPLSEALEAHQAAGLVVARTQRATGHQGQRHKNEREDATEGSHGTTSNLPIGGGREAS
jgi:hypothetical protein